MFFMVKFRTKNTFLNNFLKQKKKTIYYSILINLPNRAEVKMQVIVPGVENDGVALNYARPKWEFAIW